MRDWQSIENTTYDLIIIGGGVNGAAVARDAAIRGLKTILIEKNDFASGTSSWSTRLIHGGLRYLEYFEFSLVRESLREREVLLHTAPHLVHPLLMTIPIYGDRSRPYWKIQAGMLLYDSLSFDKTLPPHRMLPKAQFQQLFRSVTDSQIKGGAQYYDGQAELAERLCLENILDAQSAGATVLNYVEVTEIKLKNKQIQELTCQDVLTGTTFTVKSHSKTLVANTSGPWVDEVCELGQKNQEHISLSKNRKIKGTKGSHIVVNAFPGCPESCLYVEAVSDGRPFFIVPWLGKYLIGTTDLYFEGDLDKVKADDAEIDYLLQETNLIIPTAQLSRQDVIFTYSGVRPLPNEEKKKPGSVTRKHIIYNHRRDGVSNLISLIGGKLTTYRHVGQEITDLALRHLGRRHVPCATLRRPLPGAMRPNDPRRQKIWENYKEVVSAPTISHLCSIYGSQAAKVLALAKDEPELAEAITTELPDIKAQIVYAVQSELAHTLLDITRRRTAIAMLDNYGLDVVPVLTDTLQKYCGWTAEKCNDQVEAYREYMENNCIPDFSLTKELVAKI